MAVIYAIVKEVELRLINEETMLRPEVEECELANCYFEQGKKIRLEGASEQPIAIVAADAVVTEEAYC